MAKLNDLEAFLSDLGCDRISYKETDPPKILATCPMHTDSKPSFMLRPDDPHMFHCYVCGGGVGLVNLVKRSTMHEGCTTLEAYRIVSKHIDLTVKTLKEKRESTREYNPIDEAFLYAYKDTNNRAWKYLKKRGVSRESFKKYEVGYDRHKERVTFPIRDPDGALMAIMGRAVKPGVDPKFLVYDKRPKDTLLYGAHELVKGKPLFVIEGNVNKILLTQWGFENVVALLTSKASPQQLEILLSYRQPLYLFLDPDRAGAEGAVKIIDRVDYKVPVYIPQYEEQDGTNLDPTPERFKELIETAKQPHAKTLQRF